MYERHFGLTDHPFGAAPDPDFYFDSAGHGRVLGYLQYAIAQGDSFIVLTGDAGVGKTTLVRKFLRGFDPASVTITELTSTQLDALDLLTALSRSFGVSVAGQSIDELRAGLQAFLATLSGRTALAVIDEAHHLRPDALAQLAELARPQSGPLRVLLAGQPELRLTLQLHALGQPVCMSCHIGPLLEAETAAYIEHRLRRVQWNGAALFGRESYELIHRATGGVPQRINRLCDRLLLAAYLRGENTISAELVAQTEAGMQAELVSSKPLQAPARSGRTKFAAPLPTLRREVSLQAPAGAHARGGQARPPDDAEIPVLASAVEAASLPVAVASDTPDSAASLPEWAVSPSRGPVAPATFTARRAGSAAFFGSVAAAVAVAGVLALSVWVYRSAQAPARATAVHTPAAPAAPGAGATPSSTAHSDASAGSPPESVAPPAAAESPPPATASDLAATEASRRAAEAWAAAASAPPVEMNPSAGPSRTERRAARATQAGAAPPSANRATQAGAAPTPPNRAGTRAAEPAPVPGPCTATVAALGLCTPPSPNEGRQ